MKIHMYTLIEFVLQYTHRKGNLCPNSISLYLYQHQKWRQVGLFKLLLLFKKYIGFTTLLKKMV
jgi:hypothetical protein